MFYFLMFCWVLGIGGVFAARARKEGLKLSRLRGDITGGILVGTFLFAVLRIGF